MGRNLVKPEELAEILGVTKRHIYTLSMEEKIPRVKVGQRVRFDPEEVIKHLTRPPREEG